MTSFLNAPFADTGVFSMLENGKNALLTNGGLVQKLADFVGAIAIMAGVVFLVVAVVKTREKVRWFWMSGGAFLVGAMLIAGATAMIQSDAGNTWSEVFGSGASSGSSQGALLLLHSLFHI